MKELSELHLPDNVRYARDHEWISIAAPYRVGISDYAQSQMGDLTFIELPDVGRHLARGDEFCTLESTKSVSPMYSPVSGRITAVNTELEDDCSLPNSDPYGVGWIIEIEPDDPGQLQELMNLQVYRAHLEKSKAD